MASLVIDRVEKIRLLIDRTTQRLMGKVYQRVGRISEKYRPFTPVLATPESGSFILRIRLGRSEIAEIPLFPTASKVIEDIIAGIYLINESDEAGLQKMLGKEGYYKNFLAMARDLAPDGEKISSVDFISKKRVVSLSRPRKDIDISPQIDSSAEKDQYESISVEGELDFATKRKGTMVGLTTEDGREYNIVIEEGLDDLVRSYYGRFVGVSGSFDKVSRYIHPSDIHLAE